MEVERCKCCAEVFNSNIVDFIKGSAVRTVAVLGLVKVYSPNNSSCEKADKKRNLHRRYFTEPAVDSEMAGEIIDGEAAGAT